MILRLSLFGGGHIPYRWIIWYADSTSFSNCDGEAHTAPRGDVLCIAAYSADHGRTIWHGGEYYVWEAEWNEWLSVDREGLSDYLDRPGTSKVRLRGRHVPPKIFWSVYHQADQDPRLPPRSSYDALETQPK